jgi:hypothetical protein
VVAAFRLPSAGYLGNKRCREPGVDVGDVHIGTRWEILVFECHQGHRQGVYFYPFIYVIVSFTRTGGQKNLLWVADLQENEIGQNIKWEKLVDEFKAEYEM